MAKKLHLVHVKSHVLDKAPSAETINYGEIAVNYNHQSPGLYIRDDQDNVVKFIAEPYFEKIVGTGVTENDGETFTPLSEIIQQDEQTVAAALNDLEDRKADKDYVDAAVSSITIDVDSEIDSASTNPVENRVLWKIIADDEKVTAAGLNDLNDRKADITYVDEAISGVTIEVDDHLDSASTNPVENRVIANALENFTGSTITVDDHIDSGSTNPVENRVIYNALAEKQSLIDSQHKLDYSLLDNTPTIPTVESMTAQEVATAVANAWTTVIGN